MHLNIHIYQSSKKNIWGSKDYMSTVIQESTEQLKPESKFKIFPRKEGVYRANLEALDKTVYKALMDHPETPVPLDDEVEIAGLKNPLCAVVLGFSTNKVIESLLKSEKQIKHIIVIEPDMGIFHQTLTRFFVAPYFSNPKIDILV